MNITRGVAAAAIVVGTAVGFASPAWADDLNGTYTYYDSSIGFTSTWTINPCGPGCANVTSGSQWSGQAQAQLANGQWAMAIYMPDAITCGQGGSGPGTLTYLWDAATLNGSKTGVSQAGTCGDPAPKTYGPDYFTLTKAG